MLLFLLRTFTLESILFIYDSTDRIRYFYTSSTINPPLRRMEKIVFSHAPRIERTTEISIFQFLSRNLILTAISRLPSPSYHLTPATHSRTYLSSNPPRLPHNPRSHRRKRISAPTPTHTHPLLVPSSSRQRRERREFLARLNRAGPAAISWTLHLPPSDRTATSRISAPIYRRSFNAAR